MTTTGTENTRSGQSGAISPCNFGVERREKALVPKRVNGRCQAINAGQYLACERADARLE
jgi:hypothetical protein